MAISDNIVQSSYSENMANPSPGTIAGPDYNTGTGIAEAGIGFGIAVSQGVADKGALKGGALADFLGISVKDVTLPGSQSDAYVDGDSLSYVKRGQVWVLAAGVVAADGAVHYDTTTGAISGAGGATIPGARFVTSGGSGDRVLVELVANAGRA